MDESGEAPVRRGRGRPKGSLNRKTIERLARAEASAAEAAEPPDPPFVAWSESTEIMGGDEAVAREAQPEQSGEGVEDRPARTAGAGGADVDRPGGAGGAEPPPSPPTLKRMRSASNIAPRPTTRKRKQDSSRPTPPAESSASSYTDPPNFLDVLKRGLESARTQHKAEKVARYDAFFSR